MDMARHKSGRQRGHPQTATTHANVNSAIEQANLLLREGQLQQAISICRKKLKQMPDEVPLLNMLGILYAKFNKPDASEKYLRRAIQQAPDNAGFHYNLGKVLSQSGRTDKALDSFRAAIAINPNFTEPYISIGNSLRQQGRLDDAVSSYQQALHRNPDLPEVHYNLSIIYKELGQTAAAEEHCRQALRLKPDYALAYNHLGSILSEQDKLQEAIHHYQLAIHYDPALAEAHYNLALSYKQLGQLPLAIDHCREALKLEPGFAQANNLQGMLLSEQNKPKEAIHYHQQAITLEPESSKFQNSLGITYMTDGDLEQARQCFQQTIAREPAYVKAHYHLAMLKKHNADDPEITAMQSLLKKPGLSIDDKIQLEFALGKACDDAELYDDAFNYFHQGNQDKWAQLDYDPSHYASFINSLMESFDTELFTSLKQYGNRDASPIFIVGMPRSGTTLIEQILSTHPDIHAGGELAILEPLFRKYFHVDTLNSEIHRAGNEMFHEFGQQYVDELRKLDSEARHITDKMPHNFNYIGLIALALPNAKIIHCQRNPIDTCLSCYTTLFTSEHPYSYNLEALGNHYLLYQKVMTYWQELLPDRMLSIQYEDVVADLESQTRRLAKHCGLPWSNIFLDFHHSKQPAKTASLDQVNKPIYNSSVQRWKHYERFLQPLLDVINQYS